METIDLEDRKPGRLDPPEEIKDGKDIAMALAVTSEVDSAENLNGFWQRQAKRMARNPCTHFWVSLLLGIGLSVIAIVIGQFSVSANTGGWQSRGTMIADRQTQAMLTYYNQKYLFTGGDAAWENLINNVQPGWENDDTTDDSSRRLLQVHNATTGKALVPTAQAESLRDYLTPKAERIIVLEKAHQRQELPFRFTADLKRKLQAQLEQLQGCDIEWYTSPNVTADVHLWPVWKIQGMATTALHPHVIRDICIAEQNTQRYLEDHGLCFGCDAGCLPPYSIVLFARLTVPNGMGLSCEDLSDAWAPYQASSEEGLQACVADLKALGPEHTGALPDSCPFGFATFLVDEKFDKTHQVVYTSSVFASQRHEMDALYAGVDSYDRGSGKVVKGTYDTQNQDFVGLYLNQALTRDMSMAMGSAIVVAFAIMLHTRSPFITLVGLAQIILSFPLSYFVYKLIGGLDFFPFLNFIGIFVAFALGAGDIFVAVDKWKNARNTHPKATTEYVAASAFPDAAGAMFLTTITTAIAFFSTAICPVAPVKMFAIFCGLLIMFDYIMNVALVFPALCIYDKALTNTERKASCCVSCSCCGLYKQSRLESNDSGIDDKPGADSKPSLIHSILLGFYFLLHKLRWIFFVVCLGSFAITAYYASTLELPTSSDVRLLNDQSQFEQSYQWRLNLLASSLKKAAGSSAIVIWGVKPADTGDLSKLSRGSDVCNDVLALALFL